MKFLIYLFATLITLCFAVSSFALSLKNIIYYHTACPPNPYSTNHPPTNGPTNTPTNGLTNTPTNGLTNTPTNGLTNTATNGLTNTPTNGLTNMPTNGPTNTPTNGPTNTPTNGPTNSPTNEPPLTNGLTNTPSNVPTSPTPNGSTNSPTDGPTNFPTSPPNNVCNPTGGVRIIGGTDAPSGAYPYQISVRNSNQNNSHFCGGSIISDRWILTAAHCVIGSLPADKTIVAGTNLLNSGGTSYAVEQIVMHPAYDDVNFVNDYALMKVSSAIAFGPTVATIPLATQRPPVGSSALATGWGYTNATLEQVSPNLQQICVSVISNEECENVWGDLPDTVVCTFNRDGEGMCRGDSGGPLVWKNRQFGIVSFGPQLCASGFPDAYASVPDGIVWIQNITGISN